MAFIQCDQHNNAPISWLSKSGKLKEGSLFLVSQLSSDGNSNQEYYSSNITYGELVDEIKQSLSIELLTDMAESVQHLSSLTSKYVVELKGMDVGYYILSSMEFNGGQLTNIKGYSISTVIDGLTPMINRIVEEKVNEYGQKVSYLSSLVDRVERKLENVNTFIEQNEDKTFIIT